MECFVAFGQSDQVMGTIAKWGSVSVPHFKTFLSWIDHLISHLYRLITATSEGFPQPSFYYFHHCLQPVSAHNTNIKKYVYPNNSFILSDHVIILLLVHSANHTSANGSQSSN